VQGAMKQNAAFAAQCAKIIEDIEPGPAPGPGPVAAPAPAKCPPITFRTTNTPWGWCPDFCPPPFTEADRLAAHGIGPPRIRPIVVTAPAKNKQ
jgi:hypothetical protein